MIPKFKYNELVKPKNGFYSNQLYEIYEYKICGIFFKKIKYFCYFYNSASGGQWFDEDELEAVK